MSNCQLAIVSTVTIVLARPHDRKLRSKNITAHLDPRIWHRIEKELYLCASQQSAWLYAALANEEELAAEDLLVVDIRVGDPPPSPSSGHSWGEPTCMVGQAVTDVGVLFGVDAVDPRPQWALVPPSLQLDHQPKVPVARLGVLHGRAKPRPDARPALRISDTHMVTGVGLCRDAIDAHGKHLPESEADPLTVDLIGSILDVEKPDLVVAPIIERSIPFAAIFGNHDSEGIHALSRDLCEPDPEHVDGIGNFYLQVLAPTPSQLPLSTLYFLDSHGQIPSKIRNPDYDPIKQSQIDWFTDTSQAQRSAREKDDNHNRLHLSLAFLHIPLPEFGDSHLSIRGGHQREPPECPSFNSHFYDALVRGGISALGCGYNHPGLWLCYGGGCGFGGYCSYHRVRFHRRARIWELDTSAGSLTTWKRVEYAMARVDELVLVESGAMVDPREEDKDRSSVMR
ncbi:hypothetical protein B0H67DRAFT_602632 [Lasiosphaeris hirsuta]|uniref:Calcineurin-like phosphoesterase domain-containing protein n=1 Tax=Lasiosphaeris hirsuta TaxID=260670 RepID=A0AA40AA57_9PEZI|nr:hypothetical protein B0H67DRAFT_602632 [Lasiosphaeris hirsuta]